jgi:Mor family transcriptional regulator
MIVLPGRTKPLKLTPERMRQLFGEFDGSRTPKAHLAKRYGISRNTLDTYLAEREHIERMLGATS